MKGQRVVLASSNAGKLAEFDGLAKTIDVELVKQDDLGISGGEENGLSFVENALIKARHASFQSGLPALADDSGLCVDALDGMPGLRSARYAGDDASAEDNIDKLLLAMKDVPTERRHAHFYCILVYLRHPEDPSPLIAEGFWHGRILESRRGKGGFGYDAVFFDPLVGLTAAELSADSKRVISHRGQALYELRRKIYRLK
ncbi:MAG: RdgB/HAM1 family non-canonical purine NTP pyrophosphatase [Rhodanobacteraceae bacterium]|nr:RdgB/HAM1 family non-canonical purine NTP pyrophosphatase [Rhodanobacteraceae bacterium]HPF74116.1 RdgB/HAM1 family non-canonical purine NTP pyrophosphatase [Xanthomonadaceae bacterium]HRY01132.1 RdgB/HAM1 family non-canonical purine NTP pyrophosphatase [Xanthomonadaceae bacterium]